MTFEIADRGIPVFMLDASVAAPSVDHPQFNFFPLFLGPRTEDNFVTIDDFYQSKVAKVCDGDLLLQMDIEGAEWDVLATISDDLLKRFRTIVIELHELDAIFDRFAIGRIHLALSRLSKFHEVVHVHANNNIGTARCRDVETPRLLEVTYYRKDRSSFRRDQQVKLPHQLDRINVPSKKPVDIPPNWLKSRLS